MSLFDTSTFVKHMRVPVARLVPVLRYWQQVGALQLLFVFLVLVVTGTALLSIPAASEVSSSLGQRFLPRSLLLQPQVLPRSLLTERGLF